MNRGFWWTGQKKRDCCGHGLRVIHRYTAGLTDLPEAAMSLIARIRQHPTVTRWMINLYPPYLGAGVRARVMDMHRGLAIIEMPLTRLNKNYVGTQFGGSLYSMTDPFLMLLLIHKLGRDYIVWDKSASIDFKKPGTGTVQARMQITDAEVDTIRQLAAEGPPVLRTYPVDIVDQQEQLICRVEKVLYIRRKKDKAPQPA